MRLTCDVVFSYDIIAAISLTWASEMINCGVWSFIEAIDDRVISEWTKGLIWRRAALMLLIHVSSNVANQSWCGALSFMKASCNIHRMAELWWVGWIWWWIFPSMVTKWGPPMMLGKGWVVSNDAKEKIKFNGRKRCESFSSWRKMLYSCGRSGSLCTISFLLPFRRQQKPDRSPVRRGRWQYWHSWGLPFPWSPQSNCGQDTFWIIQSEHLH